MGRQIVPSQERSAAGPTFIVLLTIVEPHVQLERQFLHVHLTALFTLIGRLRLGHTVLFVVLSDHVPPQLNIAMENYTTLVTFDALDPGVRGHVGP